VQLRVFFGWNDFRSTPANARGTSLQCDIVEAGLRGESMLAILPTGGGKSLCFQLPALVRNYRRGVLTIVISPLQALMKDQVDGLVRRTGTPFAAALSGLLTPLERGDVLRRVCLGEVAVLYVSPEQLRNRSFRKAIAQQEIGCWVFDEAHCLSKWGHDFRPDYLYAGRFIREFSHEQGVNVPPVACFTATAKRDVKEEILAYFKTQTGLDLVLYEGGVERQNLRFEVQTVTGYSKFEQVHHLLSERLAEGCAIVFRATRSDTEFTAEYLREKGGRVERFHAGLTPPEKKRVQDEFLAGNVQVICATNALGMGIDKDDVRLVIHMDTPGSLENYLQEAGRAGRDGRMADCVLLFEEADCERQFRMGAFSQLTRRDIAQILRGLRKNAKGEEQKVVITTGEILRDEDVDTNINAEDRDADTKVRAAIAWLERANFIQRDENVSEVFQARLLVKDLTEAAEENADFTAEFSMARFGRSGEAALHFLAHGKAVTTH
jgi:ATP-dependent DNA helicase RecQ